MKTIYQNIAKIPKIKILWKKISYEENDANDTFFWLTLYVFIIFEQRALLYRNALNLPYSAIRR